MLMQLLWLYLVVYSYAVPLRDSKRDTPPPKPENKNNLKDAKLTLPFSSTTKLFGEEQNNENIMQNNADMTLGDNNDDEDEKYYSDDDEPDECCGKDSVQPRPDLMLPAPVAPSTPEMKENKYVDKCVCIPRVNRTMINDNNDTVPCNDTCTNRSEGPEDTAGSDTAEDAEGDTEEDAEDDPEDEDAPEEEEGNVREEAGGFACHTCNTPVVEHHHHHHETATGGGGNIVTENQTPAHDTSITKFHRHEHDHFHHESPQMITCLHDHHHHHHHHHQHHHFHYQPYCCKCDGKVVARHKSMDMSKVNNESPNELGSEVTDDANVVSGDGEMMLVGPERPEWAPPPPDAENSKSRSVGSDSDLPPEQVQAEDTPAGNNTETSTNATDNAVISDTTQNNTETSANATDNAVISDHAKANVTQMVFSSVARICDFLHNKTNSYKVVHNDTAKRCCICRAPEKQSSKGVKGAQNRCECSPCSPCNHHCGCSCSQEHHHQDHCHDHCGDHCHDYHHCGSPCGHDDHHYDTHYDDHAPCCCDSNEEHHHCHTHHHNHHHHNHCGCPFGHDGHHEKPCCQPCCGCHNRNLIKKKTKKKN